MSNRETVAESQLDYVAIYSRGGANRGDEDFALFKCRACDAIYLLEYEVPTVYIDGADLTKRVDACERPFDCVRCKANVSKTVPFYHPPRDAKSLVPWSALRTSTWAWVATSKPHETESVRPGKMSNA